MKNFPSALIKQKNTKGGLGNNLGSTLKNIGSKALSNILGSSTNNVDINSINSKFDEGYEILNVQHEIDSFNINNYTDINKNQQINEINKKIYTNSLNSINLYVNTAKNGNSGFEDPFLYNSQLFDAINNYKYISPVSIPNIENHLFPVDDNTDAFQVLQSVVAPSLFNPYAGVNFNYITEGIPLLNKDSDKTDVSEVKDGLHYDGLDIKNKKDAIFSVSSIDSGLRNDIDISDCSIRHLVELSNKENSPLGLATYRYIDFMFCKDLGKISNNHLITLRKFRGPVGDNIFQEAKLKKNAENKNIYTENPEVGRLITWFGNEDNKIEDICKYNYRATFKPFRAAIQQESSKQQDGSDSSLNDGFINKLANAFSPQNNKLVGQGFSQNYGLLQWSANKLNIPIISNKSPVNYHDWTTLSNYDQNKIYEPANTIWDTHKYEGRLEFNQDIQLTFRYTLRSYVNINPKSAFLDLIANIMSVTYRRGSFWGGETKIYGPQGNNSMYDIAYNYANKTFDKLGGVWHMFKNGQLTPDIITGWLSNISKQLGDMLSTAGNLVTGAAQEAENTLTGNKKELTPEQKEAQQKASKGIDKLKDANKKYGWTDAIKGMFKNQLGRPAIYAFNSLLSGEAVGPWHLTVGNPLNPIMSIGNLFIETAEVQHSGPLGLDDFPTEIKVTVQLKHGRPRDSVEIQKMYTRGRDSIYKPMNLINIADYITNEFAFGDINNKRTNNSELNIALRG